MTATRVRALAALSLLVLLGAARPAGAGGGGQGPCSGFTRGTAISIQDLCFQGTAHITTSGSTVTVTNHGQIPHDFTAADGSFASGTLQPGQTFELTVKEPGVIPFYCTLHGSATGSGMAGVLFVEEASSANGASRPTSRAAAVQSGLTTTADAQAANASRAAIATADRPASTYLAAAALIMSAVALTAAFARVHSSRHETP